MMKETNVSTLLFFLQIAVTLRNISATPIALPDADNTPGGASAVYPSTMGIVRRDAPISVVQNMTEVVDTLQSAIAWLQVNMLGSQFENTIFELELQIAKLPRELAENRAGILKSLYKAQDRLITLRTTLQGAATRLKDYCDNLIKIYNINVSKEILTYGSSQFVRYANFVKGLLEDTLIQSQKIQDELSGAKSYLVDFGAILRDKQIKIESDILAVETSELSKTELENKKKEIDILLANPKVSSYIVFELSCTFNNGVKCVLTYKIPETGGEIDNEKTIEELYQEIADHETLQILKNDLNTQLDNINPTQATAITLLGHVNAIKAYLTTEVKLIIKWNISLDASILDNTNITLQDIKWNLEHIKGRLVDLKKACDDYLKHDIPAILCSRNPSQDNICT